MKKYARANFYTKEILLNKIYNGKNKNINFTRYESEISKSHQKERNSQIVKLDKYDDWENSKII